MKAVVSGLGLAFAMLMGPALFAGGPSRGVADDVGFAGQGPGLGTIQRALRKEKPLSAKPVGTSSVVFKLDLEGAIDAAFRPENRLNPRGHLAEIAAYRVGRALGFDHVAPAVPRSLPFTELQRLVQKERPDAWGPLSAELSQRSGQIHGVAIYWIPELRELGFDTRDGIARFSRWLAQDGIPAALGHPRVWLEIDEHGYVDCGYCDRRFILKGGPADGVDQSLLHDIASGASTATD